MAQANRLTDSQVRGFKPLSDRDRWENDGNGLYIRIRPTGTKTWVLRRKVNKQTKKTTLGQYDQVSLRDARLLAAAARQSDNEQLKRIEAGEPTRKTFGELLDQYYYDHIEPNYARPRQVRQYIDNRLSEDLKGRVVSGLDEKQTREFRVSVREWLLSYAKSSGPIGANRLLAILQHATRFGTAIGYLTVDPLSELTRKLVGGEEKAGDRVLTQDEIQSLWNSDSPHLQLLRFLLLTGQRIGEAQKAQWDDIRENRWIIPAVNSKNRIEHWVPLTRDAIEILDELDRNRRFLFAYRSTTGVQSWLRRWCDRNDIAPRFTPHDLRRTFVTGINELGVEPYIVEKMVNHKMSGVMAIYNKAEYESERTKAAELWASEIHSIVTRKANNG
ncbi:MAG: tyrosine-type recombinase/integrase [Planctomycetota bacterium]